jgi:RNA polymerase subunit RPABC4/transcription elongation factor Spt4
MSVALFFVLAILTAAAIAQPLLPGSRVTFLLPAARGRGIPAQPSAARSSKGLACPQCGAPVKADDRFCVRCGKELMAVPAAPVCAACGALLAEDDGFCRKCGAPVAGKERQQ